MGVYIKGMAMPKAKLECKFWNTDHVCTANMDGVACDPADGVYLPENCPLVEVAEPHGRLIDADALADDLEYDAANEQDFYKANCASWLRSNCNQTIIEAEGK